MTLVLGIDPGTSGALAVYCSERKAIIGDVLDMPVWHQLVGKRKRKRVDAMAIADAFDVYQMMGVELVVMEEVGGQGKESATASFAFGYGVGVLYMSAFFSGIPIETVKPALWKMNMRVPGKSKADDTAIVHRADELFPDARVQFRGPRGGVKTDRAEAAMMAKFGADHILPTLNAERLSKLRDLYAQAQTGA